MRKTENKKIQKKIHHKIHETKYIYYTGMTQREDFIGKRYASLSLVFLCFFSTVLCKQSDSSG